MMTTSTVMTRSDYCTAMDSHVRAFFSRHAVNHRAFDAGPIQSAAPGFHVLEVAPGPKIKLFTYVSVGAGLIAKPNAMQVEFVLVAPEASDRHVELLAMTTYYHRKTALGLGHTFPLGQPWLPDSSLDHMLVSRPYPFGADFEIFEREGMLVQMLWLLPITEAERDFKRARGLEELESRFDSAAIEYWDPSRASIIEVETE
jgi:Suppressor of fused protein (SUFU)